MFRLRKAIYIIAGLACLIAAAFATAVWVYRDIPAEALEARYAAPASLFINVDGVRMHFQDQGNGEPVILIHGEFASLFAWNSWVQQLQGSYRLLRFDMSGHGLTGPDATGAYSVERSVELLERFSTALQLEKFSIAATSMGATVALHYAAKHPDHIVKLILLNPELPNKNRKQDSIDPKWASKVLRLITPRKLTEYVLQIGFGNPENISQALISRWHDLWLRDGQRDAMSEFLRQRDTSETSNVIAQITAPALVIWGGKRPVESIDTAGSFIELFPEETNVHLIIYPEIGQLIIQEAPGDTAQDALDFLQQQEI